MLSVPVHKDIGEYEPKIIGKMTARTLICVLGALGLSVIAGLYMYFVIGVNPGDYMMVIYAAALDDEDGYDVDDEPAEEDDFGDCP